MKILFISRAYPPVVGGMENHNFEVSRVLRKYATVDTIANRNGKKMLPAFLPWAIITALIKMRNYDVLLLGDGVLAIVGAFAKIMYGKKKKVICIVHGLDLTFKHDVYQNFWVGNFMKEMDGFIAVGNETIKAGTSRGLDEGKFTFIPNGVNTTDFPLPAEPRDRTKLNTLLGIELTDAHRVIFTGGRLAKRKGAAWFIRNVMPKLPENVIYAVSGAGPDQENVEAAITETGLADRVKMLGYVSNEDRVKLLHNADIFVQPNIPVDGDMEGFGMVILEAGASGIPVLASELEGLKDAIHDGKNGFLVEHSSADAWVRKLTEILDDDFDRVAFGQSAHAYIEEHFTWDKIMQQYANTIEKTEAK